LAGAALALCITGIHGGGRLLLHRGLEQMGRDRTGALRLARAASLLLPLDAEVRAFQATLLAQSGRGQDAVARGAEAVALAPYYPVGYLALASLQAGSGSPGQALRTVENGLEHAPREVDLLWAKTTLLAQLGRNEDALPVYRRIVEVQDSPAGRIRTVGQDFRYIRARRELAREALRRGDEPAAFIHQQAAAFLLAERRQAFDRRLRPLAATAQPVPESEIALRVEEVRLWCRLAPVYRQRGEEHLACLAAHEAQLAEQGRQLLVAHQTRLRPSVSSRGASEAGGMP
jgi:tetratricopeptide (TPR) repeat protein